MSREPGAERGEEHDEGEHDEGSRSQANALDPWIRVAVSEGVPHQGSLVRAREEHGSSLKSRPPATVSAPMFFEEPFLGCPQESQRGDR